MKRYDDILTSLRGYGVTGRTGRDSNGVWMRRKNLLQRMKPLKVTAFKRGIDLLMNREDGSYVIDDDLFSSRFKNVEAKYVLQGKAGTEDPAANCFACSLIVVILGMRLRVSEESQKQNVQKLLGTTQEITQAGHRPS